MSAALIIGFMPSTPLARSAGSTIQDPPIYTSPVLSQGVLYISNSSNKIYALNALTGRKEWAQSIGSLPESLTLDGATGILYIGSANGTVFALNIKSHQLAWPPRNTGDQMEYDSPPVVSGNHVYVCNDSGTLYALGAATGAIRWHFATGDLGYCAPAVNADNGDVYVATSRSKVYAFKSNGSPAWPHAFSAGPTDSASPTVNRAGNLCMSAASNGTIYALYAVNGHQAWARSIGQGIYQVQPYAVWSLRLMSAPTTATFTGWMSPAGIPAVATSEARSVLARTFSEIPSI